MSQSHNGHPWNPLPATSKVPIIGQPCAVKAWFPTVLVQCNCDGQSPLLLVGQAIVSCPHCHRRYQVGRVHYQQAPPHLDVGINVIVLPEDANPAPIA